MLHSQKSIAAAYNIMAAHIEIYCKSTQLSDYLISKQNSIGEFYNNQRHIRQHAGESYIGPFDVNFVERIYSYTFFSSRSNELNHRL